MQCGHGTSSSEYAARECALFEYFLATSANVTAEFELSAAVVCVNQGDEVLPTNGSEASAIPKLLYRSCCSRRIVECCRPAVHIAAGT